MIRITVIDKRHRILHSLHAATMPQLLHQAVLSAFCFALFWNKSNAVAFGAGLGLFGYDIIGNRTLICTNI